MINKYYEKIKKYIIKKHNYILFMILVVLVLNIKTPYVVKAPGGVIPLSKRVTIDGKEINSNFYTSYVRIIDGKVAGVIASFIFPNWDLEKYEDYSGNIDLSYEELEKVEKILMEEGNNKAIVTALKKAGSDFILKNNKLIVYYSYSDYKNDLKIGDVINKCNNSKITDVDELHNCISNTSNNKVILNITRNGKDKTIEAKVYDHEGDKIIGIAVVNNYDISSRYNINITSSDSESGSSGGFMTTLAIYTEVAGLNLPNDLKIAGTGTIEDDEVIGKISEIKYKLLGAEKEKVDIYFVPEENYSEAKKVKKKYKLKLKLVKVTKLDDAIEYLKNYK